MPAADVTRDERTVAVENEACRWGYTVLLFGVMLDVMYRGFVRFEVVPDWLTMHSNWDLMGLVLLSLLVTMVYQATHGALWQLFRTRQFLAVVVTVVLAQFIGTWLLIQWLSRQG